MGSTDFDRFVERQQRQAAKVAAIDWEEERDQWLGRLDELYAKVRSYLGKYLRSGQIIVEETGRILTEENIGSYEAPQMTLRIGGQEVRLVPVGTLLIGAKGRVDVVGPAGQAPMLLVDKRAASPRSLIHVTVGQPGGEPLTEKVETGKVEWEWKIVTRPPERRFVEITKESLFQLIMEVSNG